MVPIDRFRPVRPLETTMRIHRFPVLRTLSKQSFHTSSTVKALSALALPKAEQISSNWKGTSATGASTKNFIGGEFVESSSGEWIDVHDPVRY
jgi:malonate-semialdehyde dehydrogenase (acetylating)/methylmalonate-semialdehyde dehydrogenase